MDEIEPELIRSFIRSKHRVAVLQALQQGRVLYLAQVARDARLRPEVVRYVLDGKRPRYRPELSLRRLGLVVETVGPNGPLLYVTSRGLRSEWTGSTVATHPPPHLHTYLRREDFLVELPE